MTPRGLLRGATVLVCAVALGLVLSVLLTAALAV